MCREAPNSYWCGAIRNKDIIISMYICAFDYITDRIKSLTTHEPMTWYNNDKLNIYSNSAE